MFCSPSSGFLNEYQDIYSTYESHIWFYGLAIGGFWNLKTKTPRSPHVKSLGFWACPPLLVVGWVERNQIFFPNFFSQRIPCKFLRAWIAWLFEDFREVWQLWWTKRRRFSRANHSVVLNYRYWGATIEALSHTWWCRIQALQWGSAVNSQHLAE